MLIRWYTTVADSYAGWAADEPSARTVIHQRINQLLYQLGGDFMGGEDIKQLETILNRYFRTGLLAEADYEEPQSV